MKPSIILWDVMGTLVHDPFFEDVPAFFGLTLEQLLEVKHPTAWSECERGSMSSADMERSFFADGRDYDIAGLRETMARAYRLLPGMKPLLDDLRGVPMHVVSNYTPWYAMIERKLALSRWMTWRFVSCDLGWRKPEAGYYRAVLDELGVDPSACAFIDDREVNCEGARTAGMHAIRFEDAVTVRTSLSRLGFDIPTT